MSAFSSGFELVGNTTPKLDASEAHYLRHPVVFLIKWLKCYPFLSVIMNTPS